MCSGTVCVLRYIQLKSWSRQTTHHEYLTILQGNPRITAVWSIPITCQSCNAAVIVCKRIETSHGDTLGRCSVRLLQGEVHVVIGRTEDVVAQDYAIS